MVRAEATAKYVRTSAQKAGLVLDLIRGKDVNLALSALQFSRKSVARDVAKVLRSAVANAQQQDAFGGDVARLFVSACCANNGPSQKRVRPAPMGRAFRIVKRTTHLTVEVTERAQVIKAVRRGGRGEDHGEVNARQGQDARGRRVDEEIAVGQKVTPLRVPHRVQQDLEVAVVCGQGLRQPPARGPGAQEGPEEAVSARRRRQDRDRARRQQAEDRHPHLAAGHHHRPQGTGSRQAEAGDPEADQPRGLHQHPGDPEA